MSTRKVGDAVRRTRPEPLPGPWVILVATTILGCTADDDASEPERAGGRAPRISAAMEPHSAGLRAGFDGDGATFLPSAEGPLRRGVHGGGIPLPVTLRWLGISGNEGGRTEGESHAPEWSWTPVEASADPLGVHQLRDDGTEQWSPREDGWHHAFTVAARPGNEGPLRLLFDAPDRTLVHDDEVLLTAGGTSLRYAGLVAWDQRGRSLPAHFALSPRGFDIVVDDAGAEYPVVVDPVLSVNGWATLGGAAGAHLGSALGGIGDVNGDGFGDIALGAPDADGGGVDSGALHLHFGGPTGPGFAPDLVLVGPNADARLGTCLAHAGDVNGDGFSDFVAGGWSATTEGWFGLWYGGPAGPASAADWTWTGPQVGAQTGADCGGIGDVNDDGYADIAVSGPFWDGPSGSNQGALWAFWGSATGPGSVPDWTAAGASGEELGTAFAGAGDVNGDGYGDVVAGVPGSDVHYTNAGGAVLWFGSATGLAPAASDRWDHETTTTNQRFGGVVAAFGDIDADGLADVGVGRVSTSTTCSSWGRIFLGASSGFSNLGTQSLCGMPAAAGDVNGDGRGDSIDGVSGGRVALSLGFAGSSSRLTQAATVQVTQSGSAWGSVLASAGDVDGDGFADVLAGAPLWDGSAADEGRVDLYFGGADDPDDNSAPSTVGLGEIGIGYSLANLGDVNGDGYDDLAAGNPLPTAERVRVFHGGASGLSPVPATTLQSPDPATDLEFGADVGRAGDIDNDGFADLVVAMPQWSNGQSAEGRVQIHLGSASGVGSAIAWAWESDVAGANVAAGRGGMDVEADGAQDLVVAGTSLLGGPGL